jgi:cytoskeletal protein CcmA (bactofilin family)
MFGSNDKNKAVRPGNGGVETLIGPRVVIRGDVHFSGGIYVEGTIEGAVVADAGCPDAVVTLAENGLISGEVHAPHVVVNGQLRGDVYASGHIELAANASTPRRSPRSAVKRLTSRLARWMTRPFA